MPNKLLRNVFGVIVALQYVWERLSQNSVYNRRVSENYLNFYVDCVCSAPYSN